MQAHYLLIAMIRFSNLTVLRLCLDHFEIQLARFPVRFGDHCNILMLVQTMHPSMNGKKNK